MAALSTCAAGWHARGPAKDMERTFGSTHWLQVLLKVLAS